MNFRLTTFFFGLVVVLFAALLIVVLLDDEKTDDTGGLVKLFVDHAISEKDIDTVELIRTEPTEERVIFTKSTNGQWQLSPTGRVDGAAIEAVIRAIFKAKPVVYKELTDNLTLHGLDKPTLKVTLKSGVGADNELTVNVGLSVIGDPPITFVTTSTNKRPMAVRRSDLAALFSERATQSSGPAHESAKWLPEYRPRRLLMPLIEVQSFKLGVDGKELALTRDKSGAWKFTTPANYGEADTLGDSAPQVANSPFTGVSPLLDFLTSLQAGPEDYLAKPGDDWKKYGLDDGNPARFRIELQNQAGVKEVLFLGKVVEPDPKADAKLPAPTRIYAKREGDPAVIRLMTDRTESLKQTLANPSELRNKDALPESRRAEIDAVDLVIGASTVKLRRVTTDLGDRWVVYDAGKEPVEAKPGEVETLLSALSRPRVAREVLAAPNDAAFAEGEKKATVRVWFNGVEAQKGELGKLPPEPKLKGTPVDLVFGKREGETVFVRKTVEGANSDLKLADAVLAQVTKTRLDFLDPKLKSFSTQVVTKLTFNRGPTVIELSRPKPTDSWTYLSTDKKGQIAEADMVAPLVGLLSGLSPDRVVADSPADLKPWGLDNPRMKATVTLSDKSDTERVYHFGADVPDRPLVYAQQVGRPFVVTVPREILNRFQTDDLRDRVIHRVAPGDMTKVTIRSWTALNKQLNGKAERMVYAMEKKGDAWVGLEPAGFTPNRDQVTGLLAALADPRTGGYLPSKPEHGTDPATNPDATVIDLEAGKVKFTLVLGKPAEGGRVYAASSLLPGESVTLDLTEIRKYIDSPATLQKK